MRNSEESYRREWAALSGRSESDIYIPEALRVNSDSPEPEEEFYDGCGAVDHTDLDACGNCPDCARSIENRTAYNEARYSGAPVHE